MSLDCVAHLRGRPQSPMNLIPAIRGGAVGITVAVTVGVYLAVLLSLFDL
jgi:hypothetical protein